MSHRWASVKPEACYATSIIVGTWVVPIARPPPYPQSKATAYDYHNLKHIDAFGY